MKKMIAFVLLAVMCLSLAACDNNADANPEQNTGAGNINPAYVGEWKCKVLHENFGSPVYRHDGFVFKEDGSFSFVKDIDQMVYDEPTVYFDGQWEFDEEKNRIIVTLEFDEKTSIKISEQDGKTVLIFCGDVFYRAEDFTG